MILSFLILSSLVLTSSAAQVPAGGSLTLEEAYAAAKSQSESLAASAAGVSEAEARVRELWGAVQPNLTLQGSEFLQDSAGSGGGVQSTLTRRDRPEAKLALTQPIFSGFREYLALKAAKAKNRVLAGDLERATSLLYRDVARAYFDLAEVQHELATRRSTIELTAGRVKDLEGRARLGRSRASEVLQARVQLAQLQAQLPDAEGRERAAQEVLSFLTGLAGPNAPGEPDAVAAPDLSEALRRALARGDVDARREERDGALFLETAQRRERWPSASLAGAYYLKRTGFQEDIRWDVTLTASLPLFAGGAIGARIDQAGSRVKAAERRLSGARRQAESEARRTHALLGAELDRSKALEEAARLAEENSKAQGEDYKLGVVTNLDVLGALTALQNARLDLERSRFEAAFGRAALEAACGGPEGRSER